MKLLISCTSCKQSFQIGIVAQTMAQLIDCVGHKFDTKCTNCKVTNKYSVDNVFAVPSGFGNNSRNIVTMGIVGALVGGAAGIEGIAIGAFSGIMTVGGIGYSKEIKAVKAFNRSSKAKRLKGQNRKISTNNTKVN